MVENPFLRRVLAGMGRFLDEWEEADRKMGINFDKMNANRLRELRERYGIEEEPRHWGLWPCADYPYPGEARREQRLLEFNSFLKGKERII